MATMAALWDTLKHAIEAYTGMSAPTFFTVVAVAAAFYYGVSAMFAPPPPPPEVRREVVEPLPPPVQLGEVTEEELKAYDGSDPKKPLLMAIKGQIYDVTQSRMFYGPGGPYALFAGKDASRALAKMSFETKDLTGDISGLGPFELEALQDWEIKFMSKYEKVGTVKTVPVSDGPSDDSSEATAKATTSTDGVETKPDEQKEESSRDVDVLAETSAELRKDEVLSQSDEAKDTKEALEDGLSEADHPTKAADNELHKD